ncbi:PP2C family protein-serine/threonine phosphatase [Jannaschia pohangensis]|uniref:Serine phosphatase RsbU, regulator of sigma subunit n=1 Tax=Jannaschia pohangensis TaxID=390807 RepID=A0A1I3U837_9RHOB|nr:SpoIIE family protein phosphatase [Jannaschia pohangensis]SFJ79738.1 Serine phosphatase RsbU, regulator of sigma subunit [Jannaschia pohangensis]
MTTRHPTLPPRPQQQIRALVVDDSAAQRQLISAVLLRMGFDVVALPDPGQALHYCMTEEGAQVQIILSDWQMPVMDGPDFCKAFRSMVRDDYVYFILMTSETDRCAKARALEAGADDFVTRPIDIAELRARLLTGRRILDMQEDLQHRNHEVKTTLDDLMRINAEMSRDLDEARKLQRAFIPDSTWRIGRSELSLQLVTSGQIGGDLVGYFPISDTEIGLYSIDVSGHGVASALLTGRLAGLFSFSSRRSNIAFLDNGRDVHSPEEVMSRLNEFMLREMDSDIYFTAVLAYVDLRSGHLTFSQAGHPHPLVRRADGSVERIGRGGPPVGLLPEAEFDCITIRLNPGDAFLAYSDGMTECTDTWGDMLEEEGLMDLLAGIPEDTEAAVASLEQAVNAHSGINDFEDDISMLLFRFGGPESARRGIAAG